jgi:hypothetical protein
MSLLSRYLHLNWNAPAPAGGLQAMQARGAAEDGGACPFVGGLHSRVVAAAVVRYADPPLRLSLRGGGGDKVIARHAQSARCLPRCCVTETNKLHLPANPHAREL